MHSRGKGGMGWGYSGKRGKSIFDILVERRKEVEHVGIDVMERDRTKRMCKRGKHFPEHRGAEGQSPKIFVGEKEKMIEKLTLKSALNWEKRKIRWIWEISDILPSY